MRLSEVEIPRMRIKSLWMWFAIEIQERAITLLFRAVSSAKKACGLLLPVSVIVAAAGLGCSGDDEASQRLEINLGIVQSLSGPGSLYATSTLDGIVLAISEIEATDRQISIDYVVRDDASTAEGGVAAYKTFVEEKVTAIIGPTLSNVGFQALPVADGAAIPAISPVTTASGIGAIGDYVFRISLAEEVSLPALIDQIARRNRIQEVVLFTDSKDAYSRSATQAMKQGIQAVNGAVVAEYDVASDTDIEGFLSREAVQQSQAFLLPLLLDRAVPVLNQLRGSGLQQPAVGGEALATTDLVRLAGEAANGMYVSSTWHPDVTGEASQRFVSAYMAAHGRLPEHFAAEGHASIYVLVDAVKRARATSPERVQKELAATQDLQTVLGRLSMSADGDAVFQPVFQQFQNGRLVVLR